MYKRKIILPASLVLFLAILFIWKQVPGLKTAATHNPAGNRSAGNSSTRSGASGSNQTSSANRKAPENTAAAAAQGSTIANTDGRQRQLLTTLHQRAHIQASLNQQYLLGKSLFFQHKYASAINTEDKVIRQSPLFYKAYNVKGIALCYAGQYQQGMSNIEKAIAIAPNYDYAHFNKGLALELYGHYNEALTVYHQTIPIASHNWKMWSYYGIAAIYGRRGDVTNTVKYLRKAIAMNPKHVRAVARTEKDFDNVRSSPQFQQLVNQP